MGARSGGSSSSVQTLPPPCPKSPPEYPDLYGKRRETAKIQMLEREISFLEEELKSLEGLQPASRYCKEVTDFVMAKSDPLIPTSRKNRKSCRFWKWLWYQFLVLLFYVFSLLVVEFPALTCHGSAVAAIPGPANAAPWTAVHASATYVTAVHVNVAQVTAVHVNVARATAARVNAAARATAARVNAVVCATVAHVNAAAYATAVCVNVTRVTAVHVQAVSQSRNGNVSAAHATGVHVQAAAQSRKRNASRVLNPVAAERSHAAAGTAVFFDSLHAQIAFAANGNVLLIVQR
ncbi:hypothetical protein V6N12_015731 [Hibiscus sabdariffa]|uniref:G protein gamma domain-containing protein n=1 Tax=Hibiscus sabdariffa TaxID=183260 RepID=A0ABR2DP16_9ROSI